MFHQKTLNSFLKQQDQKLVKERYERFQEYKSKSSSIARLKEEKYQDGFLRDLFVNALGYALEPDTDFNLKREEKNENDAKKADGAIVVDGKIVAVIELKDQKTKDLDKPKTRGAKSAVDQLFGYISSHSNARYGIVSNFNELRFYFDKRTEYQGFNLFTLTYEQFELLHLVLSYESIQKNLPLKIKQESDEADKNISKQLYKDYAVFRQELFDNIRNNNPDIEPSHSLRLTQKLVDRIVFILFAEDTGLLKKHTIKEIRKRHEDDIVGLGMYDYYKIYFKAIDEGSDKLDITKYNGGLFADDKELNSLKISDLCLDMRAQKLSDYDFESDVSVNILGHIFEQSLTDLEELLARLEGTEFDSKKSKRKKDGVFYTPEYITRYIVDNTLGRLCEQKREGLKLDIEIEPPKNSKKLNKTESQILENLKTYREWLFELKICDPACGSGAFLNQALDYLIKEHTKIRDEILIFGDITAHMEIEKSILEHNLYGVDINEDAAEIAKLSLWLRTAHQGRELTKLAGKIKAGNSLISDKSVDEKAFEWEREFPEVFEKGGFDVVIGNPPYTYRNATINKEYFQKVYMSTQGNYDLYKFFMEKCIDLFNKNGLASFIVPNTFLTANSYSSLRQIIIENTHIEEIYDLGLSVFENVVVESVMYTMSKKDIGGLTRIKIQRDRNKNIDDPEKRYMIDLSEDNLYNIYLAGGIKKIINKMNLDSIKLSEISYVTVGINTGYIKSELTADNKMDERYHKMLNGKDIGRYSVSWPGEWIVYDKEFVKNFGDKGRSLPPEYIFLNEKILIQRTRRGLKRKLICYLDFDNYYNLNRLSNIVMTSQDYSIKYLYILLNSTLMDYYFNNVFNEYEVKPVHLSQLPIKKLNSNNQKKFVDYAEKIISSQNALMAQKNDFINYLTHALKLEKPTKKLQSPEKLTLEELTAELEKKKVNMDDFTIFKSIKNLHEEMGALKADIDKTDREIDKMVYELYELTDEEIKIVE